MFEPKLDVPQKEPIDYVHAAVKTAIASIPKWWAASGAEIFSMVIASPIEKRRDEFLEDLAWVAKETAARVDDLQPEKLVQNEAFVSAVLYAARIATTSHKQEKREALRHALLNVALHGSTDEDQQQTFLRYIDELTVAHLRILWLFHNPVKHLAERGVRAAYGMGGAAQVLEDAYPEYRGKREFYDQVVNDLGNRGLLNSPSSFLHTTMSGDGMVTKRTTGIADSFLAFIAAPIA